MFTMEFHPGDGGEDAKLFADELMSAVFKYATNSGTKPEEQARTITFHRL